MRGRDEKEQKKKKKREERARGEGGGRAMRYFLVSAVVFVRRKSLDMSKRRKKWKGIIEESSGE